MQLNQRIQIEEDPRQRIDQLEKRQTQDDAVINVIHRYQNQLNEDVRIMLRRFDAKTGDESEKDNENESTIFFLTQLATWHKKNQMTNIKFQYFKKVYELSKLSIPTETNWKVIINAYLLKAGGTLK